MNIIHETVKPPQLVYIHFSNKSYLKSFTGSQLTSRFKLVSEHRKGAFVLYTTSIGHFLCNSMQKDIIYQDTHVDREVYIDKIAEDMYGLTYLDGDWKVILFTQYGKVITDEYTSVREMKNGLCAAEKGGKFGFIDVEANIVVQFKYKVVSDFNEYGYAIVIVDDGRRTIIDKRGVELFDPVYAYRISFFAPTLLKVTMKNGGVGIMNLSGDTVIPYIYSDVFKIAGHIQVKDIDKYGLYTMDGVQEVECIYPEYIQSPDKVIAQ